MNECTCFCPNADLPVAAVLAPQGGPGAVVDVTIYGTQGFSVAIVSNPLMAASNTPVIATAQIVSGNILRITTGSPALSDTIAGYDALLRVCNACGQLDIVVHVDVVADITPVVTDCLLAQQLWVAEARVPAPGDLLLAFTPAGCRALLPPDVCATAQAFPGAAPQVVDTVFGNQGGACVQFTLLDIIALYDLCADLNTFNPGAPLSPVDRLIAIQGATCVTTTIADVTAAVDVCTLLQNLPNAVVQPTAAFYGQQGGACFEFLVSDLLALAALACPYLAPCDGSCAAPAYSFASQPTSGMWMNGAILTLSTNNCADIIEIGASVRLGAATSFVILDGGYTSPGSNCGLIVRTDGVERLRIGSQGAWNLGGGGGGAAGQVVTSGGSGTSPTWQTPTVQLPDLYAENSAGFVAPSAGGTLTFAIGSAANAFGNFSIALGSDGDSSGSGAVATSDFSVAIGPDANISAASDGAVAVGRGATVSFGGTGIAIGQFASCGPTNAIAIGASASASNDGSIALGNSAFANNSESTAVGRGSIQRGFGFAGGSTSTAGSFGVAIGYTSIAGSILIANAVAIGVSTVASGSASTAVGARSLASGDNSIAIGGSTNLDPNTTTATAARAVAIGYNADATAADAVAIGPGVINGVLSTLEIGTSNTNKARYSATGALSLLGTGAMYLLPNYTVATLPTAANNGGFIYVTDESGGAVPAFSDAVNWRRVTDRAIVT